MPDINSASEKLDRARGALNAIVDLLDNMPSRAPNLHMSAPENLSSLLFLISEEMGRADDELVRR
ncbi:MAG: hypothetical protein Q4G22_04675 [Paracoccus sp. (in: a-proteobacteria)]|uniref:hypothetical protein n=1 Tax=Paracoccus sp. TaxID=267 RepID=UPI0026E0EE36|nr:hypothetical protein [Paracoccus sp. (in: a-proteobacteria)]MDO5631113.1 hypothetical protein [Paracoccus sp. (in: a-proteobacteria)]